MKDTYIRIRIDVGTRNKLKDHCKQNDTTISTLLLDHIISILGKDIPTPAKKLPVATADRAKPGGSLVADKKISAGKDNIPIHIVTGNPKFSSKQIEKNRQMLSSNRH